MKDERRNNARMVIPVHVRSSSLFGQKPHVCNVSLGGMRIISEKSLDRGESVKIKLSFPRGEWTDVNMRVVWSRKLTGQKIPLYDIGCEFVDLPFDIQSELWMLLGANPNDH